MFKYKIGIGIEGMVLESHIIEAHNQTEAREKAIREFLHPSKGFSYVEVKRIKK